MLATILAGSYFTGVMSLVKSTEEFQRRNQISKQKVTEIILTKANLKTGYGFFVNEIKNFQKVQQN